MKEVFRFEAPGTLPRPGPIGRLVRFVLGALCAWFVWHLGRHSSAEDLARPETWFWYLFALLLAPYVVNIGFGVEWGAWPRIVAGLGTAGAAVLGYLQTGSVLGPALWSALAVLMVYVYGHLALSFLLSAVLATPGCEMRAIPQLLGQLAGRPSDEHYCPGFIDKVDRWERERASPAAATEGGGDLTASAGSALALYGLPYLAILLAGNFGGRTVVTVVWTAAFTVMGAAGLVNAARCRRVHCFFTGPWFLLAAVASLLLGLGAVDFGQDSWSTLVNTALFGGALLFCVPEHVWGKYFGSRGR